MTDYAQEQEMEIEALEAILMDEFKEIHSGESGLSTSNRCFQIKITAQEEDGDESNTNPAQQLALIFAHTEKYPDEPPLLNVSSLQGISSEDLRILKDKLQQEASENLGMAMIYTLVSSAKEWLTERYCEDSDGDAEAEEAAKEDIVVPHGEAVTVETFLAWRERFEAELALERAKLMPESVLATSKEKKLSGRQWFESGRMKGAAVVTEDLDEEDEEDIDFDDDGDFEDDEDDMLEHYLAEKSDSSTHSSMRAS
ncbi:putative ubiquitin-conjugating enzyme/RWD [Medicago truncatula]|uniref:Putative ubiquitin-conjugating enzyme/RWD n=1 Tax=Medicago truncatula TaxID=3880 RepID=A0A072TM40_MEDTR|nr:RWD domain-containing protein 1 [Medicago truncatula]KEH18281.1 ubiquitin-conjugating enzyme family protein [Medicago truncatula]RHN39224.1 putative ubiquitin-conjugating enzyme/RWD [Medicago truncatula]